MRFATIALAALPALAATAPSAIQQRDDKTFKIKASVPDPVNPDCHSDYNGLELAGLHYGAGFNDAGFVKESFQPAYFNGTEVWFDISDIKYKLAIDLYHNEAMWSGMTINQVGLNNDGNDGYYINDAGLQGPSGVYPAFGGWLICEWFRTTPQLFYFQKGYSMTSIPKSCEFADLKIEYQ